MQHIRTCKVTKGNRKLLKFSFSKFSGEMPSRCLDVGQGNTNGLGSGSSLGLGFRLRHKHHLRIAVTSMFYRPRQDIKTRTRPHSPSPPHSPFLSLFHVQAGGHCTWSSFWVFPSSWESEFEQSAWQTQSKAVGPQMFAGCSRWWAGWIAGWLAAKGDFNIIKNRIKRISYWES